MKEFDSLTRNVMVPNAHHLHPLPESVFDQLERFILSKKQETDTDALELMSISSKRGIGKVISAKNYVGLIKMRDGTEIEILPKIYTKDKEGSEAETKSIFLNMLRFVKDVPYKTFNRSNIEIERNTIFEVFIRMFIQEVYTLVKHGLRSDYISHKGNEFFFKGKLRIVENLKHNLVHRERFFIEYNKYSINRVENRIIKATLDFLQKISSDRKNKKDIHHLLSFFENVDVSLHPTEDFSKVNLGRDMKDYELLMGWCKLFLQNKSFTTFKGSGVAFSLLFPMEKVFESYVAGRLKHVLKDHTELEIKTQESRYHLFDHPKKFLIKPDIVIRKGKIPIIIDTKWKQLSPYINNYGISQADMYQMYAYNKKYAAEKVVLIYPWTTKMAGVNEPIIYQSEDNVTVQIRFINLTDDRDFIKELVSIGT
jgi:5-methylcytosine-specific restriction enzyme subunit McrC